MGRRLPQTTASRLERHFVRARGVVERSAGGLERARAAYQRSYHGAFARWSRLQEQIDRLERRVRDRPRDETARDRLRAAIREHEELTAVLARHRAELTRLELVARGVQSAGRLLEPSGGNGDESLPVDLQILVVEAKEAERAHLAQELHDGAAQTLANAIFALEFIQRALEKDPPQVPGEVRLLRESLRAGLAEVRSYIAQLRPPRLLQLGLYGAIAETAENVRAVAGVGIESDLAAPADLLDEAAQTVALRVAQEALQNVRKHAGATGVRITTAVDGAHWTLQVSDDGAGFDPAAVGEAGRKSFGLQFMRERARLIDAQVEVRSRPGAGTVVTLTIPIRKERG